MEVAWAADWEKTAADFSQGGTPNIQYAACRPATFFNYVYTNLFTGIYQSNNLAGMCAQGESAGSAAIAYSLAYYGAGSYLDNAELLSGPVLSDVSQGCQVPNASAVTVCGQTNYNGGQYGCQLGSGSTTWTLSPTYIQGDEGLVGRWTYDNNCGGTTTTSPTENANWLKQSIVDQSTGGQNQGAIPTFSYPSTAVSGWLCRSVVSNGYNCAANNNNDPLYCPNNSSPQGQIFYANIGVNNSPPNYAVYAVDSCNSAEGVGAGNVPGYHHDIFGSGITGANAIKYDMIGYSTSISAECTHRAH